MNTANATPGNPEERVEQTREKIDLRAKLKEFIGERSYEERKLFEEAVWEDPDHDWKETDKKWEVGFLQYVAKRVNKDGEFSVSIFQEYLKKLQRRYDNTSSSQEPELKKFCKVQLEVSRKILGLYSAEERPEAKKKKNEKERMKGIYSWENIKFTVRNIRRQIFELFLGKGNDPFFDYSQLNKGMTQLEKQATGGVTAPKSPESGHVPQTPAANDNAQPRTSAEKSVYDQFLEKRNAGKGHAASSDGDSEQKAA